MVHGAGPEHASGIELNETRTGDLWLFRGRSLPDRDPDLDERPGEPRRQTVHDDLPLIWVCRTGRQAARRMDRHQPPRRAVNDARQVVQQWAGRYRQRKGW